MSDWVSKEEEKQQLIKEIDDALGWIDWWLLPWYKKLYFKLKGVSGEEWVKKQKK